MTAATQTDYSEYVGKRVIVTRNIEGEGGPEAVELEGTVEVANEMGVMLKPKGKSQFELIEADGIEQIVLAPETSKKIKAKKIKPITLGQARSHLLERHGWTLAQANEVDEESAFKQHQEIDHVALDLGHVHEEPKSKDAAPSDES